ncbi:hypothetical protein D9M68_688490 [compost metagenome]
MASGTSASRFNGPKTAWNDAAGMQGKESAGFKGGGTWLDISEFNPLFQVTSLIMQAPGGGTQQTWSGSYNPGFGDASFERHSSALGRRGRRGAGISGGLAGLAAPPRAGLPARCAAGKPGTDRARAAVRYCGRAARPAHRIRGIYARLAGGAVAIAWGPARRPFSRRAGRPRRVGGIAGALRLGLLGATAGPYPD